MAVPTGALVHNNTDREDLRFRPWNSFKGLKTDNHIKDLANRPSTTSLSATQPKTSSRFGKAFALKQRRRSASATRIRKFHETIRADSAHSTKEIDSPAQFQAVFGLSETLPRGDSAKRPKHIPIVIPEYALTLPHSKHDSTTKESYTSFPTRKGKSRPCEHSASKPGREPPPIRTGYRLYPTQPEVKERHVEIKIPDWAQPVLKQPRTPPQIDLRQSVFCDPFADVAQLSPPDMSRPTPDSSRANTMDSNVSAPSPSQLYATNANSGSIDYPSSVNSSQSSLVGMQQEYESASESEAPQQAEQQKSASQQLSQVANASPNGGQTTAATPNTAQQLSGLVCNVHRTTGREPHPLVGATTTILGDRLYVFGGRRLSRSKPQLTSNLYELDLIRRHWTRVEASGDIPPPRYFHSVCALGDTKLVCYGGMSPAAAPEPGSEAQSEVIVMSDIHIYDVLTRTWTKIAASESPQGRYAHCAAILPSSAVFASTTASTSALQHNPQSNNPNQGSLGISIDGTGGAEMVVVGGQDSANHYIEEISVFNLRSLRWTDTTAMGRSCGAYRSVVTPLTTMNTAQVGAGIRAHTEAEKGEDEPNTVGSGAPMLIYSNYNFLDVKLELQIRMQDGTLNEKTMQTEVSPPGLRFPNGGVIDNHFVVSGTFLTSSKQEYALWALDLRTLTWSRIDAGGNIFSQGSWNRGVLWQRRNAFVILGNRKRSLVDDYNNRRINFSNVCLVELEAFGLYDNPRRVSPTSGYVSASAIASQIGSDAVASGRRLTPAAEGLGSLSMGIREMADMDFLAIDGTRIPVNSRLISRRWGPTFVNLLRESMGSGAETDTLTLRPSAAGHPSRASSVTITPSIDSGATTLTNNTTIADLPDTRSAAPSGRPRLLYLPHTAPTLHALIHFLYTSALPAPPHPLATPHIFCSLLQLARPYKIDGLLEAVVERLHESLDGRNAAAIFNAAAMAAGGGDGVHFTSVQAGTRESVIPLRTASLANSDGVTSNGASRNTASLRIDTDMANGRSGRNTLRPGQPLTTASDETDQEETPQSAHTDTSMSESDVSLSSVTGRNERDREVWSGALSAVVGLQKRGLRGLMEGRRMRERGRGDSAEGARVGLGIV